MIIDQEDVYSDDENEDKEASEASQQQNTTSVINSSFKIFLNSIDH